MGVTGGILRFLTSHHSDHAARVPRGHAIRFRTAYAPPTRMRHHLDDVIVVPATSMKLPNSLVSRRRVLVTGGAGCALAVAGCLGDDENPNAAGADDGTEAVTFPTHNGETPEPVPDGRSCDGVCGMESAAFPEWNAQVAHTDGTGAFFCSPGGLLAYVHAPEHTGAHDADIERVWVRDFETKELIEATAAYFVLEEDENEQQRGEPMGVNPRSFAQEDPALAYVAEREGLSADAVVTFDGIDYGVAHQYNTGRIPAE